MTFHKILAIVVLCVGAVLAVADDNTLNINALLKSISAVESNDHYWKVGRNGERGEYQITRNIWKKYSSIPFTKASLEEYRYENQRVAKKFIDEIKDDVIQDGYKITVTAVALRWNGGINQTHFQRRSIVYANSVTNLYECYKNNRIDDLRPSTKVIKNTPIKITIELEAPPVVPVVHTSYLPHTIFMGYDYSRRVSPWNTDFNWVDSHDIFHRPQTLQKNN